MTTQIINLQQPAVFKRYSDKYRIFRDVYCRDLLGLEIRNIQNDLAGIVQKLVLKDEEICYKNKSVNEVGGINLFIVGSLYRFKEICRNILAYGDEDLGYKLTRVIKSYEEYEMQCYNIGGKEFKFDKVYLMGILNATPDSFSDGGLYRNPDESVQYAIGMIDKGADIIDIGGESTRPGSDPVDSEEELRRIEPVIKGLLSARPEAVISVDTNKSIVAREVLNMGVKIINDISGGEFDNKMYEVVKEFNASYILMHIKGTPKTMQDNPYYDDVITEIYDNLARKLNLAKKAGIKNIIIDPGIGFGKRFDDNFEIIRRLEDFKSLGYPILIGLSRKGFIGKAADLGINSRDTATSVLEGICIKNGARIIRTHNIENGVSTVKLLKNII